MTEIADNADEPHADDAPVGPEVLPLAGWHRAHGARMVEFAGYWMPVQYEGIIAEHLWKTQLGNQPTTGVYPAEDELNVSAGFGYAIPNRALELLRPYMLAPAVG